VHHIQPELLHRTIAMRRSWRNLVMLKAAFRWISEAFSDGFELLAKLPPSALRHALYPF
jgi:hypothetical protein